MSIPITLQEWQKTSFETHKPLLGMALQEDASTQKLLQTLSVSEKLTVQQLRKGIELETSSYVGRVALGDLEITIRPKITGMPLLQLLRYAYGLRQLELVANTQFDLASCSFQDLLVYQLTNEVSELVQRGLQRKYVRREEHLASPKGRIAIPEIVRQGGITQASLPCAYYPRLEDCLINQVVLEGVHLGIKLVSRDNALLRAHLQHLARFDLADISSIRLNLQTLKRLRREMNRLSRAYEPAIALIEMLLAGEGISFDEEYSELKLPGFLFDMNRFFQALLQQFLTDHLPEYSVQSQFELTDMMAYIDNPKKRQTPKPRPDYVLKQDGKVVAILDAKYRDLWEHELPAHMLYQLAIYALSQSTCNSATILYPTLHYGAQEAKIEINIPAHNTGRAYVTLRPVHLQQLVQLVTAPSGIDSERKRTAFAQWLAFGDKQ